MKLNRFLTLMGLFILVGVMTGLRGYEIIFIDLSGLKAKQNKGEEHSTYPNVVVPLLGGIKEKMEQDV